MTGKKSEKRPRPSYEEGELRDKSIEAKQNEGFTREHFTKILKKLVTTGKLSKTT